MWVSKVWQCLNRHEPILHCGVSSPGPSQLDRVVSGKSICMDLQGIADRARWVSNEPASFQNTIAGPTVTLRGPSSLIAGSDHYFGRTGPPPTERGPIEQCLRQTEEVSRVFHCHGVNAAGGYTNLFEIRNQLARGEQHPIWRINCVPPLFRVLWNQRAPELRIL